VSTRFRRRPIFRDLAVEAGYVKTYPGQMHAAVLASFKHEEMDYMAMIVLTATAYHHDVVTAAGEKPLTYADDVAAITGIGVKRVQDTMGLLKRMGLMDGTGPAGYRLVLS
jgi:hypothetical protein